MITDYSVDRLRAEFQSISETSFWKVYQDRIATHREFWSRQCETEDDPRRAQGATKALDFILGRAEQGPLHERILSEPEKKR